ncbi:DUF4352 domain-containing protein [Shouchella sp. JSM 1781072]|uniref:DUF4352 domain-containing protein n=1 Tax=Bacillaceae TaxID=186817 RepID=UPI00159BDD71|nr:DUF4352 domain-containing protein [Bacillus sp. Marseille-P3800]
MKSKILVLLSLLACLLIVMVFALESTNQSSTPTVSEQPVELETQELNGVFVTVNGVTVTEHNDDEQIVKVDLTAENTRESNISFLPINLTLMDDDHYAYSHTDQVDTKGIIGGQLNSGRSVSGEVAFIVPKEETFELVYSDHFRGGQIVFPLDLP